MLIDDRQQTTPGSDGDSFGATGGVELGQNRTDVKFDRVLADFELMRDGLVGQAIGDQAQHFHFPRGENFLGRIDRGRDAIPAQPGNPLAPLCH